jgi:hypothetical protein
VNPNGFIGTLLLSLAAMWPLMASTAHGTPLDIAQIEGTWEKDFLIDKGVRNQDPRWELTLRFGADGKFSYVSKSTTEIRLTNGNAQAMASEVGIAGRWSINRHGQMVIKFDRAPTDHELSTLKSNLNYDAERRQATVSLDFDGALMRLSGLERRRQLFFKKVQRTR